ncbi:MAG: 30S ribosomal protein S12 methylthiotransferase RimO [Armatimonadota bacterium]
MKVSLISLGCPKNLVDSEEMLGALSRAGYELTAEPEEADAVIVNTCGFIESAKQESIDAILGAVQLKSGKCKAVVVAGCLAERYAEELAKEIPEADAFVGVGRNADLPSIVKRALQGEKVVDCSKPDSIWLKSGERVRSTPPWTAYLKIAEGCDNRCSYCAIPDIRGPFHSRPPELILAEAERMASEGVLEVNLIAQDITRYGDDIDGWSLERLAREIAGIDAVRWIRLLYCYPTRITDGLIGLVASEPKICKYMDIPLQHGDDRVLRAMNRRGSRKEYLDVIRRVREASPEIALRTSFIVGFPGEGDEEFDNLISFVEEIDFDRIGAFEYSQEDGTPAASMPNQVKPSVAAKRLDRLMRLAGRISAEHNKNLLGKEIDVLVESPDAGRCYRDAPEIDGIVRFAGGHAQPGEIVRTRVVKSDEYDLTVSLDSNCGSCG